MLGLLLTTAIAGTAAKHVAGYAAKKIGESIVENAVPLAATAVTAGVIAASSAAEERAEQAAIQREQQRAQQQVQQQMRQEMLQRNTMIRTTTLNELYAKFAICCYISWADGVITPEEKQNLDAIFLDIYNQFSQDKQVKQILLKIYNTPHLNFITLERYLRNTTPEAIASFMELAEEMAASDGDTSDEEMMCIYKIRKYLTDRTGENYMGHMVYPDSDMDLRCPGCAATMILQPFKGRAECVYCGNSKLLKAATHMIRKAAEPLKPAAPAKINIRCQMCNALLSIPSDTTKCICPNCKSGMSIRNGVASYW